MRRFWLALCVAAVVSAGCSSASKSPNGGSTDDPACEEGLVLCGGACVDLAADEAHCGQCEVACADGQTCREGHCTPRCDEGSELCGGDCVATRSDESNCGGCGIACDDSQACVDGECVDRCADGEVTCDGECVDIDTDVAHCGSCGNACADHLLCIAGECACPDGKVDCDGMCIDTDSDAESCGVCGLSCLDRENSEMGVCDAGTCVLSCSEGWDDCDGDPENGCEVKPSQDVAHCGACGNDCLSSPEVRDALCIDGTCEIAECNTGFADCDYDASTGCEIHLDTDALNCGQCGFQCDDLPNNAAAPACIDGECALECAAGWGDCDEIVANGCEIHIASDRLNCGACNNECNHVCDESACQTAVQLRAGWGYNCAVWNGGRISCWGKHETIFEDFEQVLGPAPVFVPGLGDVKMMTHGPGGLNCAVKRNNEVWCFGYAPSLVSDPDPEVNSLPPFLLEGLPSDLEVVDIAASSGAACAVLSNKELWCWGSSGDLGYDYDIPIYLPPARVDGFDEGVVEVTGATATLCARTESGKVYCFGFRIVGENRFTRTSTPELIPLPSKVKSLGPSQAANVCVVMEEGTVMCWGMNFDMQLGDSAPTAPMEAPVTVAGLAEVQTVAIGGHHTCALTEGGEVYCWGRNMAGQLGREGEDSGTPTKVEGLSGVVEMVAGSQHTCVRTGDGEILCWGDNADGQLGTDSVETTTTIPTPVEFD